MSDVKHGPERLNLNIGRKRQHADCPKSLYPQAIIYLNTDFAANDLRTSLSPTQMNTRPLNILQCIRADAEMI